MILTLDVGNSQIFGGVFEKGELTLRFRKSSKPHTSSDDVGCRDGFRNRSTSSAFRNTPPKI